MLREDMRNLLNRLEEYNRQIIAYENTSLNAVSEEQAQKDVNELIEGIVKACRDFESSCEDTEVLKQARSIFYARLTSTIFMKSPFFKHIHTKPFGYDGDFKTIDMIYTNKPTGRGIIPLIENYIYNMPVCQAVRNRKQFIVEYILKEKTAGKALNILNLGCGPAREIVDLAEHKEHACLLRIINIDNDSNALTYARNLLNGKSDNIEVHYVVDNALRLALRNSNRERYGLQDIIICSGLFDYLEEKWAIRLLKALTDLLKEEGLLIVGNLSNSNPCKAQMEWFCRWYIIHRDETDLREVFTRSGLLDVQIDREPLGINLFGIFRK